MGQSIVKANLPQVCEAINKWISANDFTIVSDCSHLEDESVIIAQSQSHRAVWNCVSSKGGISVLMDLSPKPFLRTIILLAEILSLLYIIFQVNTLYKHFTFSGMCLLLAVVISMLIMLWWRTNRLSVSLSLTEKSFWNQLEINFDILQFSRYEGHLKNKKYLLLEEGVLSLLVIIICTQMFNFIGFLCSLLICLGLFLLIAINQMTCKNLQTHWRFWIIDNMFSWFVVILSMLGLLVGLSMIEILYSFEGNVLSPFDLLKYGHFRDISTPNAELLEDSCRQIIFLSLQDQFSEPVSANLFKIFSLLLSISFMTLMTGAVYFLLYRPLKSILKKAHTWENSTSLPNEAIVPYVPYLSDCEKASTPISFYIATGILYITGLIVNWFAAFLCIDAFSYTFFGHAVFINKSANMWSWIFVFCRTVFGNTFGYIAALLFVTIVFIPILLVFACLLRRVILKLMNYASFFFNSDEFINERTEHLSEFLNTIYTKTILVVTDKQNVSIHARHLFFSTRPVIELSIGTFDFLDTDELKAVVAHELGHIQNDLWKVEILKLLSSLALFPNYILTICLNWPKYEIQSDMFALEQTGNPDALKSAIVKISATQLDFACKNKQRTVFEKLKYRYADTIRSMSFFFGDSLLGYTHPHQSQRLAAIDSYKKRG